MSDLNTYIRRLARYVRRHPRSLLTWFDDAGGVRIGGEYVLIKVDGFAASRAKYPWCSYSDFGFKAVTGAVSDVVSKGCRPLVYAVSVGVKPENIDVVEDLIKGVEEAARFYGGYVENIDTNVGGDVWVDVFVVASCRSTPIPRAARVGDVFVVPRRLGLSFIAYREYAKGRTPENEEVRRFSCRPAVDLRIVDVVEGLRSCIAGSIDISDTLYETLEQVSELNSIGIYISVSPTDLLDDEAISYTYLENIDPLEAVMGVNEEYIPMLVVSEPHLDHVLEHLRGRGFEPRIVGVAVSFKEVTWRGAGVPKRVWDYRLGRIVEV